MYVEGDDDELPVIIRPAVEIPKLKIAAPVLLSPVVTVEVIQSELKTVADPIPPEAKQEILVPSPEPQKPVIVCLDSPHPGDGVTGLAFRRTGYHEAVMAGVGKRAEQRRKSGEQQDPNDTPEIIEWKQHGQAQQEQNKHIWPGLR